MHLIFTLAALVIFWSPAFGAEPVDLVLMLATDVSRSITEEEYEIQRRGIMAALRDPQVASAITQCAGGGVALAYSEWAGFEGYQTIVPFRRVSNASDLKSFANQMSGFGRTTAMPPGTDIAHALEQSLMAIDRAPFTSARRVIDLSSDGTQNDGPAEEAATITDYLNRVRESRDVTVSDSIVINALVMERNSLPGGYRNLRAYFEANVIGGEGAFVVSIDSFQDMHQRLKEKLAREICANANF